jgi:hypothetical protein
MVGSIIYGEWDWSASKAVLLNVDPSFMKVQIRNCRNRDQDITMDDSSTVDLQLV